MAQLMLQSVHPPEIILCIADHLPASSAACLALTSRSLSEFLGPHAWASLQNQSKEVRIEFLSLLSRDMPQHFACLHDCMKLHRSDRVSWPNRPLGDFPMTLRCCFDSGGFRHRYDSPYVIGIPHIQLAIKRHQHGKPQGIPLEAFSYTEVERVPGRSYSELLSADCRIVSGELILRSQHWVLVPTDQCEAIVPDVFRFFCIHYGVDERSGRLHVNSHLEDILKGRLAAHRVGYEGNCSWVSTRCLSCQTDYQIGVQDLDTRQRAVFVTRWANLGSGTTSLTGLVPRLSLLLGALDGKFIAGSIRSAFECQDGPSLIEITEDNKNKLSLELQRGLRTRYGWRRIRNTSHWYMQASDSREDPKSVIASLCRWLLDWIQLVF